MIPIILSGGSGTRLWPVSREAHPKPFIKLADGESLLQKTYLRAARLPAVKTVLTVTNRDYYFLTRDEYLDKAMSLPPEHHFLLEPMGRNTAPAALLAALYCIDRIDPQSILLLLAADHVVRDMGAFQQAVAVAKQYASEGSLVAFGVVPTAPETGYGYIERGEALAGGGFAVSRFVEKPRMDVAEAYVVGGRHYWNSGMFCVGAQFLLQAAEQYAPELLEQTRAVWRAMPPQASLTTNVWELPVAAFSELPNISLDYAILEKAEKVVVVPADIGWSDVGTWDSLADLTNPDAQGNRVLGEAELVDTQGCYIRNEGRLVATVGVHDLVIVDTPDALLVADRNKVQEVKQVVARLKANGHESVRLHRTVARPWGTYTVVEEGPGFKIKRIVVKPGAALSLQMHYHRSEHWIVVTGMAKVVNGEREMLVDVNESTFIPAGHKHRLSNPGLLDLVIIEVQSGSYLGEDDIVRYDDRYGRN